MKTLFKLSIITLLLMILQNCDVHESYYYEVDVTPPLPPTGIEVFNGDNRVDLYWRQNNESDLAGYNIFYSDSYDGKYYLIGSSDYNSFVDYDAVNGETYYYAVTAYDFNGNESDLSMDVIYSTPRPEGYNQAVFDFRNFPNNSGYSFSLFSVVAYDSIDVDFFFENYEGDFYIDVWDDTDLQDMGPTNDIYDVPVAPISGWSSTKDARAYVGHTYVFWTWDNHFAKIRISSITNERMVFDWAYQLVEGEPMLKRSGDLSERKGLERNWSR